MISNTITKMIEFNLRSEDRGKRLELE